MMWLKTDSGCLVNLFHASTIEVDFQGRVKERLVYRVLASINDKDQNSWTLFRGSEEECNRFLHDLFQDLPKRKGIDQ